MSHIDHWDDPEDVSWDEVILSDRFVPCAHEREGADRIGNLCRDCGVRLSTLHFPAEAWQQVLDEAAAYLAADPGWKVGPDVVANAEANLRRLRGEQ